jgi:hypothetical protein
MATETKTNIIGYFNPNDYPLQLSIAEFNMVLQLQPKSYVVDRAGHLVNDPVLNRFVGKGRMARLSDQKQQVEFTMLRPINDAVAAPGVPHSHSVTQAQRFETHNGRVTAVPQANPPTAQTPPPVSYNPVRGMSIEQAKQLKLVKPTKPVPEDFGADESTGAPRSGQEIPTIRYATDSVRGRRAAPLPAELTTPATPQQQAIIAGLERAATMNPEDPNVLSKVARNAVMESIVPPPPLPTPIASVPQPPPVSRPAAIVPPPIPTSPQPTEFVPVFPAPQVSESGMVVEDEIGNPPDENPPVTEPVEKIAQRVDAALRVPKPPENDEAGGAPRQAVTCPMCAGKAFANVGMLRRHARANHPTHEAQLLAPYA